MTNCIINGCVIHDTEQDRACNADLFKVPGYWIAHLARRGQTFNDSPAWEYDPHILDTRKILSISYPRRSDYFEKDLYLMIPEHMGKLNEAAEKYVGEA